MERVCLAGKKTLILIFSSWKSEMEKKSRNDVLFRNVETSTRASTLKNGEKKSRVESEVVFFTISFVGLSAETMYSTTLIKNKNEIVELKNYCKGKAMVVGQKLWAVIP